MPPRRHRANSNVHNARTLATPPPPPPNRTITPSASAHKPDLSEAIYQTNLKVMLRREPSITGTVDQFSHVCLYRFDGKRWEKHGYEGSMFIFKKSTYPTYGFYILNRMGTEDYIRPIYPEDDMEISGEYLMVRFYPDYTQLRLEMGLPYPIPEETKPAFNAELQNRIPPEYKEIDLDKEKRGRSIILGLWMFATDTREPLKYAMMRLHDYIKKGLPYPEEFHYGPGRPPPPLPHFRTASSASVHTPQERTQTAPPDGVVASQSVPTMPVSHGAGSELDSLFAKLLPSSSVAAAPQPLVTAPGKSVLDLFAALNGGPSQQSNRTPVQPMASSVSVPVMSVSDPGQTSAARSLLDMMFASAAQSTPTATPVADPLPPQPEEIVIVSPKPTSSALPHVLTQEVLSSIMGLAPDSRASSAAPSSVGSRRSAQRYEGDNEYSEGDLTSEGEFSRAATTCGSARSIPTLAVPQGPSSESEPEVAAKVNGSRRIPGDVTPRPPAGGIRLPPTSPPHFQQQRTETPAKVNGNGAVPSPAPGSAPRNRPLVPFEANSDLWPYPRAPLDDRSLEMQDDVVELDYSDTRALSDPAIFTTRLKEKKERKDKGRKSRKEREREKEREKAEIEKGWDLPTQSSGQPAYQPSATGPVAEAATAAAQLTKNPKQVKKVAANGGVQNGAVDGTAAKDAIIAAMAGKIQGQLERNDFVREVLTLIHTDKQFVDNLWQDYLSRAS
ncbi:hypothetical protein L227DRAFT_649397 [Lentinus tigrinus ALCF2SS1-6]|uniref:PH domain-like protein n=1 Tax=Lentinus tigrinus ALCF2SS1-6 TaxID=1328759 RepID=A0A5C2SNA2_9APHY|nr:hypothetical protein L227DRAFT_649397 [Lentinus tigrinus ALCF2SS1-6]